LKRLREAFTIIEVLVSVVLIAIVALGAVKMQQESRAMALYLADRGKNELSNTLFLGADIMRYNKDKKDAYTMIEKNFKIDDSQCREILKKSYRTITVSEPMEPSTEEEVLPIEINEIILKGKYPSRFFQFKAL
jgi:prepilin-type N-terminal cleavage/methylation domain-containing protein